MKILFFILLFSATLHAQLTTHGVVVAKSYRGLKTLDTAASGYVLTSNGGLSDPSWQPASGGSSVSVPLVLPQDTAAYGNYALLLENLSGNSQPSIRLRAIQSNGATSDLFTYMNVNNPTLIDFERDINGNYVADVGFTADSTSHTASLFMSTLGGSFILKYPGSGNWTLTVPLDGGSANQVLTTDGTGVMSWADVVGVDTSKDYIWTGNNKWNKTGTTTVLIDADETNNMVADGSAGGSNTTTTETGFLTIKDSMQGPGVGNQVGLLLQNIKPSQNGWSNPPSIRTLSNVTTSGPKKQVIWDIGTTNFSVATNFYGTMFSATASFADTGGTGIVTSGGFFAQVFADGALAGVSAGSTEFRVGTQLNNDNTLSIIGKPDSGRYIYITPNSINIAAGGNTNSNVIISAAHGGGNNLSFVLPPNAGSLGKPMITDGSGNLSWGLRSLGSATNPTTGASYSDNQIIAWGNIASDATITSQYGNFSIVHTGTGIFTITLPTTPSENCGTVSLQGSTLGLSSAIAISGATVTVKTGVGAVATDEAFYFIITGRP